MKIHADVTSLVALAAVALAAGCASQAGSRPLPPTLSQHAAAHANPDAVPPSCKGQKTTRNYASVKDTFSSKGGRACIPAFKGLGGTVQYPPANPATSATLIGSTTNYNKKLPELGSGKAVYYLQIAVQGGTSFGQNAQAGGGLTGKPIKPGQTYTVFGRAVVLGFPINFTPCYTVARKGKYGGVIGGIGTLLQGQNVPAGTSGVIEIYPGKNATGKC